LYKIIVHFIFVSNSGIHLSKIPSEIVEYNVKSVIEPRVFALKDVNRILDLVSTDYPARKILIKFDDLEGK